MESAIDQPHMGLTGRQHPLNGHRLFRRNEQRRQASLNQAKAAADALRPAWLEVQAIHLFGSSLDEHFHDYSDLDLWEEGCPRDSIPAQGHSFDKSFRANCYGPPTQRKSQQYSDPRRLLDKNQDMGRFKNFIF